MIEKVARAICAAQGLDWEAQSDGMTSASGGDNEQEGYIELARAAIEAMREPTEPMVGEGGLARIRYGDRPPIPVANIWTAMINAALKEQAQE